MGISNRGASGIKAGTVAHFAASTAPAGWLKANGATVSRTTYAALFAAIGTTFGAGDGATTFALPDLRGEFFRSLDDSRGIDPGRSIGSAQAEELKSHLHYGSATTTAGSNIAVDSAYTGLRLLNGNMPTTNTGGTETRPRNVALLACIKY